MKAWTDYPFVELGDTPHKPAPVRQIEIVAYDQNKYITVIVEDNQTRLKTSIKSGYAYVAAGRYGEVASVTDEQLSCLN